MIYILAVMAMDALFMTINMIWMRMRRRGVATRAILAIYILVVPVFVVMALIGHFMGYSYTGGDYWFYTLLWACFCFFTNILNLFLFKYVSLIEIATYRFTISVIFAFVIDLVFMGTPFSFITLSLVMVTLFAGSILNFERKKYIKQSADVDYPTIALPKILGIVCVISVLTIITLFFFKKALALQDNYIFHAACAQSMLFTMFFAYGGGEMIQKVKERAIKLLEVVVLCVLIIGACLLESFAFQTLPILIIVLLDVIRPLVFSIHDIITKDIPASLLNMGCCAIIILGIVGISMVQNF